MTRRSQLLALALALVVVALTSFHGTQTASAGPCDPPVLNPIVCENSRPGNPASEWDVLGAGDPSIQGFATDISVDQGQTISFKVNTSAPDYRIDIYRIGYYNGQGARLIATVEPSVSLPQTQPPCLVEASVGLVDCGNWAVSASWNVPADAVSGVYIGRLVRESGPEGASHIIFIVRDDDGGSDLLFQTSDTTWQAYNLYGGISLYNGPEGRGQKVSYNRPFVTRQGQCCIGSIESFFWSAEYPMVRWLERNGYDVSYFSGVDTERRGAELLEHQAFLSVGHDEYWSAGQRSGVEAARNSGVHLAFFSGNEVFWKTRWESSIDGSGTPFRTLVTYKETSDGTKSDPSPAWTGTWRDPRFSPPSDGGNPENALTGTLFMVNGPSSHSIDVPAAQGRTRFWRNTSIAGLPAGETATLPTGVLGYEWDEDRDNGARPPGLVRLSDTKRQVGSYLVDYGTTYGTGLANHALTLYRHSNGALVFGAGTVQWSWGLDATHDVAPGYVAPAADARMQQATVNLLADMGVQPGSLQSGLVPASPSTDTTPPSSAVTSPAPGATIGGQTVITGTAADTGGVVGGVEVSVDDGQTWHPATGGEQWSYTWNPAAVGEFSIMSRAVDDSGNLGPPSQAVSVTTTAGTAAFDDLVSGAPLSGQYPSGQIAWNQDEWLVSPPVGAFETFSISFQEGLTDAGFSFVVPRRFVSIQAMNTTSAASTVTISCAGNTDRTETVPAGEVVTISTAWQQPCEAVTIASSNGWDTNFDNLVFDDAGVEPDTTPPTISNVQAAVNGSKVTVTWTTNENADTRVEYGPTTTYGASTPLDGAYVLTHSVTLTGLALDTTYHYRVHSRDAWGNPATSEDLIFTTSCPCSFWDSSATPAVPAATDTVSIELGVKFESSTAGYLTGIRFYKGSANTGTHTAHLWTADGTLLASATFLNESSSGWQTASFAAPVPITAGTTYVASYHAPNGGFSYTRPYFTGPLLANPLAAPADAGVFRWGSSGFPIQSFQSSNYWVDVVFSTSATDAVSPVVEAHMPAADAVDVSPGAALTAVFSEPVDPDSISFVLEDDAGTPVPASLTYDAPSRTATLDPASLLGLATSYTAALSTAVDLAGNVMTPVSWSFETGDAAESIWSDDDVPAFTSQSDTASLELGMKFRSEIAGYVRGIRFYKGPFNTGTHVGSLWSSTGELLARVTFTNETAGGWQEALLPVPVQISPNTTYIVSYHAPNGGYSLNQDYFADGGASSWPLQALADGVDGPNGLYKYGPIAFPDQSYAASNYWVDVLFGPAFADSVVPVVTETTPAAGATKVSPSTSVTATFSEAVDPESIAFTLETAAGQPLNAAVVYDALSSRATLTPASTLPLGASYTARVSGAMDTNGNMMAPFSWSFSTPACPCTLWDSNITPALQAQNDSSSVELGVKFESEIDGYITALRFFKGPGNTGTHIGNLWSETGELLTSATFTAETESGWQEVTFPGPIAIEAGTTYVASYFAPNGHYAVDFNYFVQAYSSWPLTAPDPVAAGGNGVYRYASSPAFPSTSTGGSNYWVDVVFSPSAADAIPPSVIAVTPEDGDSDVMPSTVVTATFNEAIDVQSLSFVLRDDEDTVVPANLGYDPATRTANLEPEDLLPLGTTFEAVITASDIAGNEMPSVTWDFETLACPCSLWGDQDTPAISSQDDTQAIEVGLRFISQVDGYVTGIRFYKGSANTGSHEAHLWTATGQLLASATFLNETTSGWQEVSFSSPVPIQASLEYVVSYHAPNGGYARTPDYFPASHTVFPLAALAGNNGVYAYGASGTFPTSSFASTNYWVDLVFEAEP